MIDNLNLPIINLNIILWVDVLKIYYIADVRLAKGSKEEMERLRKQLKQEQLLKAQAVNKLAEIMNRKDINSTTKNKKVSSADLKRKEKECRKLQQELTQVIHHFLFLLAFTLHYAII